MSRLPLLLALVMAFLLCRLPAVAQDEEKQKSWVGCQILTKEGDTKLRRTDEGKEAVVGTLSFTAYSVLREDDGWIRVRHRGVEGWLAKDTAIVLGEAVPYFTAIIRSDSHAARDYASRALAYRLKGKLDLAIKDNNEAIRLDPTAAVWWNQRGMTWHAKKDYDRAIKDFDEAIRLDPEYASAFLGRAIVWHARKNHDRAIQDFGRAIAFDPDDPYAFHGRAVAWHAKQDYDRAIKDYDQAIALDPKVPVAFFRRACAWDDKKDYDRAIKDYGRAIALDPGDADNLLSRGSTWIAKKEYGKALKDFEEAIRLNPRFASAHNNRAWILATCPDPKYRDGTKGMEAAKRACELTEWKNWAYVDRLAAAYAEAGQFDEAVAWEQRVLDDAAFAKEYGPHARRCLQLYKDKKPYREE